MDDRIFVLDLLPVKLKSAVCNIESTQNSSKVNDTFSGLTTYLVYFRLQFLVVNLGSKINKFKT